MSVPTSNLYDFIHQVTKRQFWMIYFYPWGSRDLTNITEHYKSTQHPNLDNTIPWHSRRDKDFFPPELCNDDSLRDMQPVLFCYDQEPLMFDLYNKEFDIIKNFLKIRVQEKGLVVDHTLDLNLRYSLPWNMQKYFILLHSELNSSEVDKYNDSGMFKTAFWWSHAMISRDWYRFAKFDLSLGNQQIKNLFLVYCRDTTGYRTYRKDFLSMLNSKSLNEHCYIPSELSSVGSDASATYVASDFNSTAISIVLETVFDQRIHLTEKILRPIACGHPFIIAAGPGTLGFLKRYGFKTFSPFIDESYDSITDNSLRLQAIASEMKRISLLNSVQLAQLLSNCQEIADHNKKVFFSDEFQDLIVNELVSNVNQAFKETGNEIDFESHRNRRNFYKKAGLHHEVVKTGFKREAMFLLRKQRLASRG